ncbi:YsnF/AvaK domain-containing protein [Polyangium mundeleinium]|uniref:YsnF/AvaK domain-containing protein n=1 Tax=Polyangium mundeleinium TaxID=2995306 RepID=A0ABT5EJG9_9BACT|nr:YsnF/AvaK domain-containing protein [Polyangium mundeleinium]MDC0741977.1 YsnF/AvaK domain-containing protein [Polyangium mundeleinium]
MANPFVDQVREGMEVRTVDGHKLGKVVSVQADDFVVEKGFFFPKDYMISCDDIAEVREDTLVLLKRREELSIEGGVLSSRGLTHQEPLQSALRLEEAERTEEAARLSLHEEQVQATTHTEQVGEVRIHKDVVTEERQLSVPVKREVVTVERVPVAAERARSDASAGKEFQEESIVIPIREEVVDIQKRSVVTEEIVVMRATEETEAPVSATIRREVAEVISEGEVEAHEVPLRKTGT